MYCCTILDLSTIWEWSASLPGGFALDTLFDRRLGDHQSYGEEKNLSLLPGL
jgi:hypothetical protein